jgi:hypothetical protein
MSPTRWGQRLVIPWILEELVSPNGTYGAHRLCKGDFATVSQADVSFSRLPFGVSFRIDDPPRAVGRLLRRCVKDSRGEARGGQRGAAESLTPG